MHMHIHIHIHIHIHMHMHMHIHIHMQIHITYIYTYTYIFTYIYTYMYTYTYTNRYTHTYTHTPHAIQSIFLHTVAIWAQVRFVLAFVAPASVLFWEMSSDEDWLSRLPVAADLVAVLPHSAARPSAASASVAVVPHSASSGVAVVPRDAKRGADMSRKMHGSKKLKKLETQVAVVQQKLDGGRGGGLPCDISR